MTQTVEQCRIYTYKHIQWISKSSEWHIGCGTINENTKQINTTQKPCHYVQYIMMLHMSTSLHYNFEH